VSLPVRFSPEAAAELRDAAGWYEERHAGLGSTFLAAVDSVVARLTVWPGTGSPVEGLGAHLDVRRAPLGRFPYHLAYLVTDDAVQVLAVAHDRRRPRYWSGRTES